MDILNNTYFWPFVALVVLGICFVVFATKLSRDTKASRSRRLAHKREIKGGISLVEEHHVTS